MMTDVQRTTTTKVEGEESFALFLTSQTASWDADPLFSNNCTRKDRQGDESQDFSTQAGVSSSAAADCGATDNINDGTDDELEDTLITEESSVQGQGLFQ